MTVAVRGRRGGERRGESIGERGALRLDNGAARCFQQYLLHVHNEPIVVQRRPRRRHPLRLRGEKQTAPSAADERVGVAVRGPARAAVELQAPDPLQAAAAFSARVDTVQGGRAFPFLEHEQEAQGGWRAAGTCTRRHASLHWAALALRPTAQRVRGHRSKHRQAGSKHTLRRGCLLQRPASSTSVPAYPRMSLSLPPSSSLPLPFLPPSALP